MAENIYKKTRVKKRNFGKRGLFSGNLIWNVDGDESEINETAVKVIFIVKSKE